MTFIRHLFETFGGVFKANSWGVEVFRGMEPKDMQTMLLSAFDCFGREPVKTPFSGSAFTAQGICT